HHALDRVAARLQRLLEAAHEDAVVRLGVARIHLRDQQDPHRGILAGRDVHRFGTVLAPTSFNANLAAKAANATPFKWPENGLFRPGSHFREYYFDETGDTNAASTENDCCGGWGSAFKITQSDPSADSGHLTIFYKADGAHAAFDNIAFLSDDQVTFVQDQGEGLHGVEGFDSGFVFDVNKDYSDSANQPVRWLAQGRDPSATLDAANGGFGKND